MCSTTPAKTVAADPGLAFPDFPDPYDAQGNRIPVLSGSVVEVPLWYWMRIAEYVVEVEKTKEIYKGWREIYVGAPESGNQ